ncbi:hypothetical protein B0H14DRAFT_2594647 [Mycena olivaceomarginata]|nr:hypothetical protein B0H14DRAFT_2594647 [Mycena olivaceomarginata]
MFPRVRRASGLNSNKQEAQCRACVTLVLVCLAAFGISAERLEEPGCRRQGGNSYTLKKGMVMQHQDGGLGSDASATNVHTHSKGGSAVGLGMMMIWQYCCCMHGCPKKCKNWPLLSSWYAVGEPAHMNSAPYVPLPGYTAIPASTGILRSAKPLKFDRN